MAHYYIHINLCSINTLRVSFLWRLANWLYKFLALEGPFCFWLPVIWQATILIPVIQAFGALVLFINWAGSACDAVALSELLAAGHTAACWQLSSTQMWGAHLSSGVAVVVCWEGPGEGNQVTLRGMDGESVFSALDSCAVLWGMRASADLAFLWCKSAGRCFFLFAHLPEIILFGSVWGKKV